MAAVGCITASFAGWLGGTGGSIFADQWDYHRQLAQDLLGHYLPEDRVIHHKDWNKKNNAVGNLEVVNKAWHDLIGNRRRGQANAGKRRRR